TGLRGLDDLKTEPTDEQIEEKLRMPGPDRILYVKHALKKGMSLENIHKLSWIDPWFLYNMREIVDFEAEIESIANKGIAALTKEALTKAKQYGFSDAQLGRIFGVDEFQMRKIRIKKNVLPTYKLVDTCGAEFEAMTPYFYSTYEVEDESRV
ncbi:MAG TPA: carbamoyl phosphate synthase large subunit, partial [bacterium]|nr:carbamoyl phosphate synthase large subunit [bacterium]